LRTIKNNEMESIKKNGRPIKESARGRIFLSSLMQPYLKKWLKKYADDNNITVADVLENAVLFYKYEKEKNE
jgi:2-hydroxy-3-keto-5-methylthiopentenyl-1-phosphate phosphatase